MNKTIGVILLSLIMMGIFYGTMVSSVSADENYNDYSEEYSDGPGEPPEDGMSREEPRTRFKDV